MRDSVDLDQTSRNAASHLGVPYFSQAYLSDNIVGKYGNIMKTRLFRYIEYYTKKKN